MAWEARRHAKEGLALARAGAASRLQAGITARDAGAATRREQYTQQAAGVARIRAGLTGRSAREDCRDLRDLRAVATQDAAKRLQGGLRGRSTRDATVALVIEREADESAARVQGGLRGHRTRQRAEQMGCAADKGGDIEREHEPRETEATQEAGAKDESREAEAKQEAGIKDELREAEATQEAGVKDELREAEVKHEAAVEDEETDVDMAAVPTALAPMVAASSATGLARRPEPRAIQGAIQGRETRHCMKELDLVSRRLQAGIQGRRERQAAPCRRQEEVQEASAAIQAAVQGQQTRHSYRSWRQEALVKDAARIQALVKATATRTAVRDVRREAFASLESPPRGTLLESSPGIPPQEGDAAIRRAAEVVASAYLSAQNSCHVGHSGRSPSHDRLREAIHETQGLSPGSLRCLRQCQDHYTQAEALLRAARCKTEEAAEAAAMVQKSLRRLHHIRGCWEEKRPLSSYYHAACGPYEPLKANPLDTARARIAQGLRTPTQSGPATP